MQGGGQGALGGGSARSAGWGSLGKSDRGARRVLGPILRRVEYGINHLDPAPVIATILQQIRHADLLSV
jgi:hypothetical protein